MRDRWGFSWACRSPLAISLRLCPRKILRRSPTSPLKKPSIPPLLVEVLLGLTHYLNLKSLEPLVTIFTKLNYAHSTKEERCICGIFVSSKRVLRRNSHSPHPAKPGVLLSIKNIVIGLKENTYICMSLSNNYLHCMD